jgi:WD40-like Beta Propeller Repeat
VIGINSRQLILIAACVGFISLTGQVRGQSVSIRPDRLREGDGKTRDITLEASVAPGAWLSISVSYSSDPSASNTSFIPKYSVQDNSGEDRNPQDGKIRLVLPKAFDKTGVYLIEVDEPRSHFRVVHEPNTSSYFRQFVDRLVAAAGGGERDSEGKSALERIHEVTKVKGQDKIAIWTAPMPALGQEIDQQSPSLRIRSALMPAWSRNGNYIACSAWRNEKWIIAAYGINRTGAATQLWQWNRPIEGSSDFSPAWSPDGDAVAFVRLDKHQKSDIWILQLDRNRRPKREFKVTDIGKVQAVLGWDKDVGLLFETRKEIEGHPSSRQVWATRITIEGTAPRAEPTPLSDAYSLIRGSAPLRRTLIYAKENDSPPISVLYEMNSSGKRWPVLVGDFCSRRWPTVSHDERWLAFEFDCPR